MPKKMRTTRNLLLMATLLGSALFAVAADKEMTIGAIYLDTRGYYAGVRQGVQDAAKDSSVQVQLIETNAQVIFRKKVPLLIPSWRVMSMPLFYRQCLKMAVAVPFVAPVKRVFR